MNPAAYLDAAKAQIGVESDYELARRLDIPKQDISRYRLGQRIMNTYICTKLAITLELDPIAVIADIESQTEKNEKRREFWRSFLSRVGMVAAVLCTLALSYSDGLETGAATSGGVVLLAISSATTAYFYRRRVSHNGAFSPSI